HKQRDWGAHETLGSIIGGFTLAVLIAAIVARPGRRHLIGATVLFVLAGPIQPILADAGKNDNVFWGVLHALCGIAILGMCGLVSRKVDVTTAAPPTATPTPAAR
ncbi:MAG TPA: hypothetical protein VFR11_15630, partial [Micromonosporaceae bacterium]|nr:hypothetical protein [Micromonosporaceae bacterium]